MSISPKQLAANRLNARHSTGPRTAAGLAVASRNALKHGLRCGQVTTRGEDPAAFEAFRRDLFDQLAPVGLIEERLADQAAACLWKLQRLGRLEPRLLDTLAGRQLEKLSARDRQVLEAGEKIRQMKDLLKAAAYADAVLLDTPASDPDNPAVQWRHTDRGRAFAEGRLSGESEYQAYLRYCRTTYQLRQLLQSKGQDLSLPRCVPFDRAADAWFQTADGQAWLDKRWSPDPDSFSPSESFNHFWVQMQTQAADAEKDRLQASSPGGDAAASPQAQPPDAPATDPSATADGSLQPQCTAESESALGDPGEPDLQSPETPDESESLAAALVEDFTGSNVLLKFSRYQTQAERSLYRVLNELAKRQYLRKRSEALTADPHDLPTVSAAADPPKQDPITP